MQYNYAEMEGAEMGRLSTRMQYQDTAVYESKQFVSKLKDRDYKIFLDWIGGMTGPELAKKWFLADITIRQRLTFMKHIYDDIKRRKGSC